MTSPAAARRARSPGARLRPPTGVADPSRGTRVAIGIPLLMVVATAAWVAGAGASLETSMADGRGPRPRRRRSRARRRAARAAELVHGLHARHRSRSADRRPSPRRRRRRGDTDHPPRVGLAAPGGRGRCGRHPGTRRRDPRHGVADRRRPLDRDRSCSRHGGRGRRERGRPLPDHAGAQPAPSARALAARAQSRLPRGDSRRSDAVCPSDGQRRQPRPRRAHRDVASRRPCCSLSAAGRAPPRSLPQSRQMRGETSSRARRTVARSRRR